MSAPQLQIPSAAHVNLPSSIIIHNASVLVILTGLLVLEKCWQKNCLLFCPWKYIGYEIWSLTRSLKCDLQKTFFNFPFELFQFLIFYYLWLLKKWFDISRVVFNKIYKITKFLSLDRFILRFFNYESRWCTSSRA